MPYVAICARHTWSNLSKLSKTLSYQLNATPATLLRHRQTCDGLSATVLDPVSMRILSAVRSHTFILGMEARFIEAATQCAFNTRLTN